MRCSLKHLRGALLPLWEKPQPLFFSAKTPSSTLNIPNAVEVPLPQPLSLHYANATPIHHFQSLANSEQFLETGLNSPQDLQPPPCLTSWDELAGSVSGRYAPDSLHVSGGRHRQLSLPGGHGSSYRSHCSRQFSSNSCISGREGTNFGIRASCGDFVERRPGPTGFREKSSIVGPDEKTGLQEQNGLQEQKGEEREAAAAVGDDRSKEGGKKSAGIESAKKLMAEFMAARESLRLIPDKLHKMPAMDPHGVYANHNLRLDQISVYGFDYDYTLAHYSEELQPLIYDLARDLLVADCRYPASCQSFRYDPSFPIRGLFYDKRTGYLLKLDFFHSIEPSAAYYGRRRLTRKELNAAYGGKRVGAEHMRHLVPLMDLFCLSEICLIADVIQHFVEHNFDFDPAYVYEDVKLTIQWVHKRGSMHRAILRNPSRYLLRQEKVVEMLRLLHEKGKKLFILTNSPFPFVDGGMRYLFQDDGEKGASWRKYFDVVVALADKPNFYTSERPFRYFNLREDSLMWQPVEQFVSHGVYYHGCLKEFLRKTKWSGKEVLYFGDHLYSDLRGPAKAGWRTAAIVRELEAEIVTMNKPEYRYLQAKYHVLQELLGKYHSLPANQADSDFLNALQMGRAEARTAMGAMFNHAFGSVFLTESAKESAFAYNVQRYADVYTSRLENFLRYSTDAWLYTPHNVKILPHHVKVGPSILQSD